MAAETKFARCGNVFVGYQVTGDGEPDIVLAPGLVSHLELDWEDPERVKLIQGIGEFARLIRFDKRGTGVSDRPGSVALLEERIEDIHGVMDAAGSKRATILGVSEGGSMACLFVATYPERTERLVLWGTKARWLRADDYPWGVTREEARRRIEPETLEAEGWPPQWYMSLVAEEPGGVEFGAKYFRSATTPSAYLDQRRMLYQIDLRDMLASIRVPTLVVHRTGDRIIQFAAGRDLASRIPGARFVELPGEFHAPWRGDVAENVAVIRDFVTGARPATISERALTTILFVDLVDSTRRAAEAGDAPWRELLSRHYACARDALRVHGGREVDTAGDGLLATFDGPARAIACARAIQRADGGLGLVARAGVHSGEVERDGASIRGIAVHTAARIASLAGPNEVLVSSTVQDLVAGAPLAFEDRGTHELKGVPGPRRLLAVAP